MQLLAAQVQPVPAIDTSVRPDGTVSVTVTVPLVGPFPVFLTVIVYAAPVCPCVKLPLCVLAMLRTGGCPLCVTLTACPATRREVVRDVADVFSVRLKVMVALPAPLRTDVTVSQEAPGVTDHPQEGALVTKARLPLPAAQPYGFESGVMV